MFRKAESAANPTCVETHHDYTVIERGPHGHVAIEVNAWNSSTLSHDSARLHLLPEEALLLANMLTRHADEAETKFRLALAATG